MAKKVIFSYHTDSTAIMQCSPSCNQNNQIYATWINNTTLTCLCDSHTLAQNQITQGEDEEGKTPKHVAVFHKKSQQLKLELF